MLIMPRFSVFLFLIRIHLVFTRSVMHCAMTLTLYFFCPTNASPDTPADVTSFAICPRSTGANLKLTLGRWRAVQQEKGAGSDVTQCD